MGKLEVYGMPLSQPCRSVSLFCKVNDITHTDHFINLLKGEHKQPEYLAVNKNGKVPCIVDNGFVLAESPAILKYLALKKKVADHWYPVNLKKRVRIDEFLHWQHEGVRSVAFGVFRELIFNPKFKKIPTDEDKLVEAWTAFHASLDILENAYLGDNDFITSSEINIGDICAITEIMQIVAINPNDDIFANHPKLGAWKARVQRQLNPHFDEVHKAIMAMEF